MNYDDITMNATLLGERTIDGWTHDAWSISLKRGPVIRDFSWKAGTGHRQVPKRRPDLSPKPVAPEKLDVLSALQSDVRVLEFDEFDDLGCTGYRERVNLEVAIREARTKLRDLFDDQYQAFLNDEELMER